MNNANPPTGQIIDFDNYDPFGANGNNNQSTARTDNTTSSNNNVGGISGGQNNNINSPSVSQTFSPTSGTEPGQKGSTGLGSIFSINYYRTFFDIQGDQVFQRALASIVPQKGHLEQNIKSSPDLYGPIWIGVSLVVSSAISHGIAQFIQNAPNCVAVDTDMRRTSFVATCVFLYAFLLPSALWAFLKYAGSESRQSLPSYMCLYGYSLAVFIPISILWVIRLPAITWPVMMGATAITGYALLASLWPSLQGLPSLQTRLFVSFIVAALHLSLAVALGSYAFEPSIIEASRIVPTSFPIITSPAPPKVSNP